MIDFVIKLKSKNNRRKKYAIIYRKMTDIPFLLINRHSRRRREQGGTCPPPQKNKKSKKKLFLGQYYVEFGIFLAKIM